MAVRTVRGSWPVRRPRFSETKITAVLAGPDFAATTAPERTDRLILTAAVGMHMQSQLLLKLQALAQASHATRRYQG